MNRSALTMILPIVLVGFVQAAFGDIPPVVTRSSPIRIWVDQIGYRTDGNKMAVIASDQAIPDDLRIELRDEKSNRAVWKLSDHPAALTKFDHGNKDRESGDFVDQLDFSEFTAPGRYYLALTAPISFVRTSSTSPRIRISNQASLRGRPITTTAPTEKFPRNSAARGTTAGLFSVRIRRPKRKSINGKSAIAGPTTSATKSSIRKLTTFMAAIGTPAISINTRRIPSTCRTCS